MAVTRAWKVYGNEGHRQRESFAPSCKYDWSKDNQTRVIEIQNSDITGTNEYSVVIITRNTAQECEDELWGQITDGIFENSRVGKVEEIVGEESKIQNIVDDVFDYIITTYAGLTEDNQEDYGKYIDSYVNDYVESTYKEELTAAERDQVINAVVDLWEEA